MRLLNNLLHISSLNKFFLINNFKLHLHLIKYCNIINKIGIYDVYKSYNIVSIIYFKFFIN